MLVCACERLCDCVGKYVCLCVIIHVYLCVCVSDGVLVAVWFGCLSVSLCVLSLSPCSGAVARTAHVTGAHGQSLETNRH